MNIDLLQAPTTPSPPRLGAETLSPGRVLAGRFLLESLAGRGGMGSVYRAKDTLSGQRVAVKLLHPVQNTDALQRFSREAELLAELRHPAIVSHVAHGFLEQGHPFLAMEWLEGEDLASRLARQPLSLSETLTLVRRTAEALAAAHRHGIVHRDLKPSNLFLRHGRPEEVVLLDFGLARRTVPSQALTGSHVVLGTPGYMAPEQASGQGETTPSADIFSLGCVLYECLTGQPPFSAPHFAAVLAKILFAPPTPLRTVRNELPEFLQPLVDRMLAKDPHQRVPDAPTLLPLLPSLEGLPELEGLAPTQVVRVESPMEAEQQLVSILLAAPPLAEPVPEALTQRRALRDSLRAVLTPHRAQVELMADGSLVLTLLAGRHSATDQAALAARCALSLKERWPEVTAVLVTGRGVLSDHLPVGEAMDRAGKLLHRFGQPAACPQVVLDEVTAGLLGPGFQLDRASTDTFLLHGENLSCDDSRPLLGKPTPCVGREQELALLELALTTSEEDSTAQALLVVAPPGTGKSRLRHEFLRRVDRREHPVLLLQGRGDPMSVGASMCLLGQALQHLCGVMREDPLEVRQRKLRQRLALHLSEREAPEVVALLGELCGAGTLGEGSPKLLEARGDPGLMNTLVGQAFITWLRAESRQGPVLLVLEDLHWGDALTVQWVDRALRELADSPLLVLALARPEIKELFPGLWAQRLQEVALRSLSRKAGAQLIREVLGPTVADSVVDRLLEQSAGNALFLEELIRMAAEGRGDTPPGTVLAMLQARILRLEHDARQALLAGSILGRTFWIGAVRAVRSAHETPGTLEHWLERLVTLEIIEPQPERSCDGEMAYRFRHALMRDAAYALVPEAHKITGHRLVGEWLEQVGETDPRVLAEHASLGQQPERAIHFYTLAAEQLLERGDARSALQCMEAALGLGAQGEVRSKLRALQATATFWMNDPAMLNGVGREILPELKPGSTPWCKLISSLILSSTNKGQPREVMPLLELLLRSSTDAEGRRAYAEALCFVSTSFVRLGARQEAAACLERLLALDGPADPLLQAYRAYTQAFFWFHLEDKPWQAWQLLLQAEETLQALNEVHGLTKVQSVSGLAAAMLGDLPGAVARAQSAVARASKFEQPLTLLYTQGYCAVLMAISPEPADREQARAMARAALSVTSHSPLYPGMAYLALAKVALADGQPLEAEAHARKARELLPPLPALAGPLLSRALMAQGRTAEARQEAEHAVLEQETLGALGAGSVIVYLALAEACFALDDGAAGEASLRKALHHLRACTDDLPDPAARERFLRQVPSNARTLELAHERWGEVTPA
ncbi:protein kinase domain-containing protein [Hyalangium sp.]|uniref:protein kinase domain-containing protein n=1 Tax=Hyalangium sp. TaxID=2028555 RepID=UPI002D276BF3|nr:protein kinase [Hyalangium sp.]HYH99265.1 protein kinase [Hyalangium sp.]